MSKLKVLSIAAMVVLGSIASMSSFAYGGGGRYYHGGHSHTRVGVGFVFGAPFAYSPWYYSPYYAPYYYPGPAYYPAPVAYPSGPTTYVEQGQEPAAAAPRQDNYWYYCPEAKAYYPYVSQCAGGWQKVSPTPQS